MANKKNKCHHRNGHQRVFWSKKTALKYIQCNDILHNIRKNPTAIAKLITYSQQQTIPAATITSSILI